MKHPRQPVVMVDGVARFKRNAIVRDLLTVASAHGLDLNEIALRAARGEYNNDDHTQLAQLIGYSVSGYGELSYVSDESVAEADAEVEQITGRGP